jgi:hypothetical protein
MKKATPEAAFIAWEFPVVWLFLPQSRFGELQAHLPENLNAPAQPRAPAPLPSGGGADGLPAQRHPLIKPISQPARGE